jgi:hypothetical protein
MLKNMKNLYIYYKRKKEDKMQLQQIQPII